MIYFLKRQNIFTEKFLDGQNCICYNIYSCELQLEGAKSIQNELEKLPRSDLELNSFPGKSRLKVVNANAKFERTRSQHSRCIWRWFEMFMSTFSS